MGAADFSPSRDSKESLLFPDTVAGSLGGARGPSLTEDVASLLRAFDNRTTADGAGGGGRIAVRDVAC